MKTNNTKLLIRQVVKLADKLEDLMGTLGLISLGEAASIRETSRSAVSQLVGRERLESITILGKPYVFRKEVEEFENDKPGPRVAE
jgi:hypothetical protein